MSTVMKYQMSVSTMLLINFIVCFGTSVDYEYCSLGVHILLKQ